MAMAIGEPQARLYCQSIGADPDEVVWGYVMGERTRVYCARWRWYVGAKVSGVLG